MNAKQHRTIHRQHEPIPLLLLLLLSVDDFSMLMIATIIEANANDPMWLLQMFDKPFKI